MEGRRRRQLDYSSTQPRMLDATSRRQKGAKIVRVLEHFLGRDALDGVTALDVGCSGGLVGAELVARGARVVGTDIDRSGLELAAGQASSDMAVLLADGEGLPIADRSFDVVVCNHVYEHVVSDVALFAELRRVLRDDGVLFLGLGNRLAVMEPHHRLPFLSWLPPMVADRYVRATGRASAYHERFRTRRGLRRLCRGLHVWDYTLTVLAEPHRFAATDAVPGAAARLPMPVVRALSGLVPTYLWIATLVPARPAGPAVVVAPRQVST